MPKLCLLSILVTMCLYGCISANSNTGSESSAEIKAKQSSSQSSTNSDMVRLEVASTTITAPDGSVITIGGAKAETGSKESNNQDQMSKFSAKADAMAEAQAKASENLSWLILGIVALLVISGGSRLLALARKFYLKV